MELSGLAAGDALVLRPRVIRRTGVGDANTSSSRKSLKKNPTILVQGNKATPS